MNILKVYKTLTYILALPTAYLSLTIFSTLLQGIINPLILFVLFIFACCVIYAIASFIFLKNILINNKQAKKIIKDLIRINGTIAFIFSIIIVLICILILTNLSVLTTNLETFFKENHTEIPPQYTKEMLLKMFAIAMGIMGIYCIILAIHIRISFRLLKQYATSFLPE